MIRVRAAAAICGFAARSNLRSRMSLTGAGAFVAIALLGHAAAASGPAPVREGDRLLGYAFLVGAVFLLRSGLSEQRKRRLDAFLRHNFVSPLEQAAGHAGALVVQLVAFTAFTFAVGLVLGLGDLAYAAWYASVLGLAVCLFLPVVLLVEMTSDFRLPFVLVPIGLVIGLVVSEPLIGAERFMGALGLVITPYDVSTLAPLAVRVIVAVPALLVLLVLLYGRRHRRHA